MSVCRARKSLKKNHHRPFMDLRMIFSEHKMPNKGKERKRDMQFTQRRNLDLEREVVILTCAHLIVHAASNM